MRSNQVATCLIVMAASCVAQAQPDLDELFGDTTPQEAPASSSDNDAEPPSQTETNVITLDADNPQAEARWPERRTLEEIVVTARRREESLQDVPIAIAAFTGEYLAELGIDSTEGLATTVPGITVSESGGFGQIYIRGFGSNAFVPFVDPTVAVLIDGAYAPAATSAVQYLGNVKSIEVLKGPQGTLFGRNTTAGAVQLRTDDPSDRLEARIGGTVGSFNRRAGNFVISAPLLEDWLGAVVGGFSSEVESHEVNLLPDAPPLRPTTDDGLFAKIVATPVDWLELRAMGIHNTHDGAAGGTFFQAQEVGLINAGQPCTQPRVCENNVDPFGQSESTMLNVRATAEFEPVEFWVQYTKNKTNVTNLFDGDGTGVDEIFNINKYLWDNDTIEIQFASNEDWSIGNMPVNWLIGAMLFEGSATMDPVIFGVPPSILVTLLGLSTPPILGSIDGANFKIGGRLETKSLGLYANAGIELLDWMTLDLGFRYSDEERIAAKSQAAVTVASQDIPLRDSPRSAIQFDDLSPLVGLSFRLADGSLLYTKYSSGFKSGTWNLITLREGPTAVPEETVDSWEIGYKASFLDRQLELNAAVFQMDYEGLQAYQVALVETGSAVVRSIDEARTRGAEIGVTYLPPFSIFSGDEWRLTLGGSYLDAKITAWPNAPTFDRQTYASTTGDETGNDLHGAPEWSGSADLSYRVDVWRGRIGIGARYYYNSGIYFDPQNFIEQEAYELISARLNYELPDWNLRMSVVGDNLSGSDYRAAGQVYDFGEMVGWAPGREWRLSLDWQF